MRTCLTCLALVILLVATSSEARKRRHPSHPDAGAAGHAGAVCRRGEGRLHEPTEDRGLQFTPCAEGLVCGYPCGIQGCDWVCMTPADAQQPRP